MEILDPDLWNDDGTPKRPSKAYMESLATAQAGDAGVFLNYARVKRETKAARAPEVGDIVHFWGNDEGKCFAAIVLETTAFSHDAELRVHIPHKPFEDWFCVHDEGRGEANGFHWPCGEGQ
jgi:hypothetical protein